jgi:hypothetical protein
VVTIKKEMLELHVKGQDKCVKKEGIGIADWGQRVMNPNV